MADRRLLAVALGAFGLDDDIDNRFFIRKVLEEGTHRTRIPCQPACRQALSRHGRGLRLRPSAPQHGAQRLRPRIVAAYRARQFEVAVGAQSPDMRLALGLERELADLAARDLSENAMWFTVMATPPLRTVFESAFGLPPSIGTLDIDRQLELFKDRARAAFGD